MRMCVCAVPHGECQKTACNDWFFPSTTWVQGSGSGCQACGGSAFTHLLLSCWLSAMFSMLS